MKNLLLLIVTIAVIFLLSYAGYLIVRVAEEEYTVEEITIHVLTSDNSRAPIPYTIVRLEQEDGTAVQNATDKNGKIFFNIFKPVRYEVRATQVYCNSGIDKSWPKILMV